MGADDDAASRPPELVDMTGAITGVADTRHPTVGAAHPGEAPTGLVTGTRS